MIFWVQYEHFECLYKNQEAIPPVFFLSTQQF